MTSLAVAGSVIEVSLPGDIAYAKSQADLAAAALALTQQAAGIATAVAQGRYYASYAAGNAATTAGQYFAVFSGGNYEFYLHGTATPVFAMPKVDPTTGSLTIGSASGPMTAPTKITLDLSYANSAAPTNQQLKLELLHASGTEAYGWTLDNIGRLWAHSGNTGGGGTGGHVFAVAGVARWQIGKTVLGPVTDNVQDAGTASERIKTIYLVNSPSVTSDAREKEWRGAISDAELRAAKRIGAELGFYRWLHEIATMGAEAPLRFGTRAQRVIDVLQDEGLLDGNPARYGLVAHHEWTDQESGDLRDRFSLDLDQLSLFLIAAQEVRLAAIEAAL